jgi:S-DNA-T family DNA segregation ATPase FtsK/SpoIIIE
MMPDSDEDFEADEELKEEIDETARRKNSPNVTVSDVTNSSSNGSSNKLKNLKR